MSASLEFACESHLLALLAPAQASGGKLDGIPSHHFERTDAAILDCVIAKATAGEHELSGLMLRKVNVDLIFASQTLEPEQVDGIADAMSEQIYSPSLWPNTVFPGQGYIESESEMRREDGRKVRKRIFSVPMIARLADFSHTFDSSDETFDTTLLTFDAA